ncbi:ABC transporter substrate-binding protein [Egicoccus halophilus]|uniref:ABC transporter substrate-binding protein n=1 Tax=Egicoccus halophilus TaxID=1670830 RepID=A0A8J3ESB4_9ACTN|nr:ABC transporter substrate-binding protein [Egicoccus halophilus]GGI07001.1 ABC transporter substrate-binding protein [Egicoccus halophilus]
MAALSLAATACGGSDDAEGGSAEPAAADEATDLTVVMWGGEDQEMTVDALVMPWAEEQDVEIRQDSPSDYAKIRAQVESERVTWGAVEVEPNFAHTACENGWATPIDFDVVDVSAIDEQFVDDCAVPILEYAFTIAYNTETFPTGEHPTSWAEFFDTEAFPGQRGFWRYATGAMFEAALLADGVAPDELYPLDIDRAFAKLDSIKDDIVFYDTGQEQVQLVSSGEVPLIQAWNGRIFEAAEAGQPVANEWNEHLLSYDQLIIPQGYPNTELAQEWMDWFLNNPQAQADYANASAYAPVNEAAMEFIDDDVAIELPTHPDNAAQRASVMDYRYWSEHYDPVSERLNEWMAAG